MKCPKCSEVIVVPKADTSEHPPVREGRKKAPRRQPTRPAADRDQPKASISAGGFPNIDVGGFAHPPSHPQAAARTRGKSNGKAWMIAGGAGALVLVLVVAVAVSVLQESQKSASATLIIDWPEGERADAAIMLDKRKMKVPKQGPVKYAVSPGSHRVVLMRRGYSHIKMKLTLGDGESHHCTPQWDESESDSFAAVPQGWPKPGSEATPTNPGRPAANITDPSFGGWLQDMEKAKRVATARNRDILILFDGSDWCGYSIRMGYEVFLQTEFHEQADWRFVLVFVDFPKKSAAKTHVEDAKRNAALAKRYGVDGYPTIILTDSQGRPYGKEGYREGGVETFIERIAFWQSLREQRDKLFSDVDMAQDKAKLEAIKKAVVMLKKMSIVQFYGPTLEKWKAVARQLDPDNKGGSLEVLFEVSWIVRLMAMEKTDKKEIGKLIAEFEDWAKKHKFKSNDRAALLHLYAARSLAANDQIEAAEEHISRGLAQKPKDKNILAQLRTGAAAVRGVGVGTGFVVSPDGYVLTNHHVIKDAKKLAVRLPGRKDNLPVRVIAKDSERDMALLQFEVPEGVEFEPVAIVAVDMHRGARVGAFGFPLGETVGSGLKLTTGVVSATVEQSRDRMMLLDCRVNPGNSGGPLCNSHGSIVGMVTAKSLSSASVESYGMALPGKTLIDFLKQKLPNYQPPTNAATDASLEWDAIDRRVGPTVLMIVRAK